jgi:hypothetical protein
MVRSECEARGAVRGRRDTDPGRLTGADGDVNGGAAGGRAGVVSRLGGERLASVSRTSRTDPSWPTSCQSNSTIARARQLLGWEPEVEAGDGLRRTIEQYTAALVEARARVVRHPPAAKVRSVVGRSGLRIVLVTTLVFAAGAGTLALGSEGEYRARAYVIQVPAALGSERGVALARSERVLRHAIALSRVEGVDFGELLRRSTAESTSRLDIALTVQGDRAQEAIRLATAYAKAVRRAIPDDEGLPTRGVGARRAQGGLGPFRWPLIGALLGLAVGAALAIVNDGLRRGSVPAPRPASPPYARARRVTRG